MDSKETECTMLLKQQNTKKHVQAPCEDAVLPIRTGPHRLYWDNQEMGVPTLSSQVVIVG